MCELTTIDLTAATANYACNAALLAHRPDHWKFTGKPPAGMTPQDIANLKDSFTQA